MPEQILLVCSFLLVPYISIKYLYLDILSPCVVFQYFWIIMGLFPYLIFVDILGIDLSADGLVFILVFLLFMTGGSWIATQYNTNKGTWRSVRTVKYLLVDSSKTDLITKTITVLSIASIIAGASIIYSNGLDLSSTSLMNTGSEFARLRNTEALSSSSMQSGIQNLAIYLNALLLGSFIIPVTLINKEFSRAHVFSITLPLISVLFIAVSQGQKGIASLFLTLVASGLIMFFIYNSCKLKAVLTLFTSRVALQTIIFLTSVSLSGLFLPFLSRGYSAGSNEFDLLLGFNEMNPLLLYAIGHIHNFLTWYADSSFIDILLPLYDLPPLIHIFRDYVIILLGIENPLPPGLYDEYMLGNIYTVFRGLIEDLGIVGSFAIAIAIGFLSELSIGLYRSNNQLTHLIGASGLILFFEAAFQSYGSSAFVWKISLILPILYSLYCVLFDVRPPRMLSHTVRVPDL